jgi:fucose permease
VAGNSGSDSFQRGRPTWLAYLLLAFYSYFLNSLGPITPFLKDELKLSYTVSGLHFTAFAAGILIVGLAGDASVRRMGRYRALWVGAFGISVSVAVLIAVRSVVFTIAAAFFMGLVGSLILVGIPSLLSDLHGEWRPVALSEANMIASLVAMAAPLAVGWAAHLPGGWRWALGVVALAPFLAWPWAARTGPGRALPLAVGAAAERRRLPWLYWLYWLALVLAVSVEFCMIFWSANYLETSVGMRRANAAQSVSLFLAGMVVGRLAGSRLVRRFPSHLVVIVSVSIAAAGFGIFWAFPRVVPALLGLFVAGLGVASMYPLIVSLAIGVAEDSVHASARATLASGSAILVLPLVLGRLADAVGIRPAYGVVGVLLIGIFLIALFTRHGRPHPGPVHMFRYLLGTEWAKCFRHIRG